MLRKWNIAKGNKELAALISERHGVPRFAAHLLITRGLTDEAELEDFLTKDAPLCDPLEFADMDKAVERILRAVDSGEMIGIFGDYDVDGVTATSLLYSYLESCEANVMYMLPDRAEDGYGLHMNTIDKFEELGVKLIITVDNGISAYEEVEYAKTKGIDVVVTDHHQPPERLPDACAVVDPHRSDCGGAYKDFAGVGVAFKLVCALDGDDEFVLENYADLVALGTVADIVPLTGENRRLVMYGLDSMKKGERPGILSLATKSGIGLRKYRPTDISFTLAPRINAAGRVGKPDRAVQLMLSDDPDECDELAQELCSENAKRVELERKMASDAWEGFDKDPSQLLDRVVLVVGEGWNKGVIGIFASRMCEALGKPCFVLSVEDGIATGSGRSIEGFSLYEALSACSEKLVHFGGHSMAAGLTIKAEDIEYFRQQINDYARMLGDMPAPTLDIDCLLPAKMVNLSLYRDSFFLEPFGAKNPAPVIGITDAVISDIKGVGENRHQRVTLKKDGASLTVMCFRMPSDNFHFKVGDKVDCAVALDFNESYACQAGDDAALTKIVKDIRFSDIDVDSMIKEERVFEKAMRGEELSDGEKRLIAPTRQQAGMIYMLVKDGFRGALEDIAGRVRANGIGYGMVLTALEAMSDRGLITVRRRASQYSISPADTSQKKDLFESEIMKRLHI
ncbi:MAG: single-stranded-DNA-specific exonuclease RecJ [Clostridia bacterium]|nr:single-stranded-DNA-specific exonuclease RecJ [Clostridia bacterium]